MSTFDPLEGLRLSNLNGPVQGTPLNGNPPHHQATILTAFEADILNRICPPLQGDIFHLGKHKGRSFELVIKEDPQYIRWLLTNCDSHHMMTEVKRFKEYMVKFYKID
jgi:hypothetical protein